MATLPPIAIIGAGNLGCAIADGLVAAGATAPEAVVLTRRHAHHLDAFAARGFAVTADNRAAVRRARLVIVAVEPQQLDGVLDEIAPDLVAGEHTLISVVTGARLAAVAARLGDGVAVVRAMPNTAVAVREAMTCLATRKGDEAAISDARAIFDTVGRTLVIDEENMTAATALGACGIAFFLRAIRAASQGGIEIGFASDDALAIAAQTARGAATLLLANGHHPEYEIDRVTTPRGCTIAGLNRMEQAGFSAALITGIRVSAQRAAGLYVGEDGG
ncbi:MAG: pyrroline-5-carboxylate reductase [Ardenticatenales bacterium]